MKLNNNTVNKVLAFLGFDKDNELEIPADKREGRAVVWQARIQPSRVHHNARVVWVYSLRDNGVPTDTGRELSEFILDEYD